MGASRATPDLRSAYALLAVAPLFFATNAIAARWIEGAIPPVALAFWRWSFTLIFLVPYAGRGLLAGWRDLAREWPVLLVLGGLGMGVCGAPVYLAAQTTTATNIGLIYAATPVLIVVFAWLGWREPVSLRQAAGIALSLAGVVAIVARGDPAVLLGLEFVVGDLLIVVATIAWALYSVVIRRWPGRQPMAVRFVGIVVGGIAVMAPFYLLEIAAGYGTEFGVRTLGIFLLLALVPGIGAYLAYGRLVSVLGPGRTGMLMYLVPLYNAGLAWMLLGERLALHHLAGAALVLSGIALATVAGPRVARPARGG